MTVILHKLRDWPLGANYSLIKVTESGIGTLKLNKDVISILTRKLFRQIIGPEIKLTKFVEYRTWVFQWANKFLFDF